MEKIGYIKKVNKIQGKIPNGFEKEDFEDKFPIIYLEAKLNNIWDINYILVKDLKTENSFIISDEYLFKNKTENKIQYKIDEERNIIISGYFRVINNLEGNFASLESTEDIKELKEKPNFFSTDFDKIFKVRKFRKELKWYKQKNNVNKIISEIFSIKKINEKIFGDYISFYNEDLILKNVTIKSAKELIKNSEEYIFEE